MTVNFVTFLWSNPQAKHEVLGKFTYTPEHVFRLFRGIKKHYHKEDWDFTIITDTPRAFDNFSDPKFKIVDLKTWYPNAPVYRCYPRLKLFDKESAKTIGPNIISLDLDMLICGDITDLINSMCAFYFIAYQDSIHFSQYSCSFMKIDPNSLHPIWDLFDRVRELDENFPFVGSDQGWVNTYTGGPYSKINPGVPFHFAQDYQKVVDFQEVDGHSGVEEYSIIMFNGMNFDMSIEEFQERNPWIEKHWI